MSVYGKQRSALAFCALSVPAVMILPRANWLSVVVTTVLAAMLCCVAPKKRFPKIMLAWNFVALGAITDLMCSSFEGGNELIGVLLLLLAAFAASRDVMLRAGAVAVILLVILYCMLLGFSLPRVVVSKVDFTAPWYLYAAALSPMLFADEGVSRWSLGGFVLLSVFASLVCGSGGFLDAMKSVSILGVMQRLEPLASVAMIIGGFCLLGWICNVNRQLLGEGKKCDAPLNFLLGGVGVWVSRLMGAPVLAIGTAIFWGLLPLLPQPIEIQKKLEKN